MSIEKIRALYLTYDGLLDPLGRSQIVPYLERFAAKGMKLTVISFEKPSLPDQMKVCRAALGRQGIHWIPLKYHRRPAVISTAWDILEGLAVSTWVSLRWRPTVVHARSYVAALIALWVKRLTRARFLFDIRGFWPEERVEGGLWKPNSRMYRIAKWWEARFFRAADGVVILAEKGKKLLEPRLREWGLRIPVVVIPTCVDLERFSLPPVRNGNGASTRLAYIGSVGTWYLLPEMAQFFSVFRQQRKGAEWMVLANRSDPVLDRELGKLDPDSYKVHKVLHEEVPSLLMKAQATLCFIKPVSSKLACCPTKVGESLACGLPVVVTAGTGDCDDLVEREKVGVVVREYNAGAYRTAADRLLALLQEGPALAQRCRNVARDHFNLEKGVEKYLQLYCQITGEPVS